MKWTYLIVVLCLLLGLGAAVPKPQTEVQLQEPPATQAADNAPVTDEDFPPVDDMHHFMEYVQKPPYMELRKIFAKDKISRGDWRKVKRYSLVLAETCSIVAARPPEDEAKAADWKKITVENYKHAAALYKSATPAERDVSLKHWGAMIDACNRCHEKYDEKNHQLAK